MPPKATPKKAAPGKTAPKAVAPKKAPSAAPKKAVPATGQSRERSESSDDIMPTPEKPSQPPLSRGARSELPFPGVDGLHRVTTTTAANCTYYTAEDDGNEEEYRHRLAVAKELNDVLERRRPDSYQPMPSAAQATPQAPQLSQASTLAAGQDSLPLSQPHRLPTNFDPYPLAQNPAAYLPAPLPFQQPGHQVHPQSEARPQFEDPWNVPLTSKSQVTQAGAPHPPHQQWEPPHHYHVNPQAVGQFPQPSRFQPQLPLPSSYQPPSSAQFSSDPQWMGGDDPIPEFPFREAKLDLPGAIQRATNALMGVRKANPAAYRNLQLLGNLAAMLPEAHPSYKVAHNAICFRVVEDIFRITTGKEVLSEALNAARLKEPEVEEATKSVLTKHNLTAQKAPTPHQGGGDRRRWWDKLKDKGDKGQREKDKKPDPKKP